MQFSWLHDKIGNMKEIEELKKKLIFTTTEIKSCFEDERKALYWINSSIDRGVISKIRRGLYALINPATGLVYVDKFMISSAINDSSYVAYHGALEFHGLANQIYNHIYVASEQFFSSFEYGGISYERVNNSIINGVITVKSSSDIKVTNLERTIVDCIDDTKRAGGEEELLTALSYVKKLDYNKIIEYLKNYSKINLWQKTAYLLEQFNDILNIPKDFYEECESNITNRAIYFLNDGNYGEAFYNKKWKIVAPVKIII